MPKDLADQVVVAGILAKILKQLQESFRKGAPHVTFMDAEIRMNLTKEPTFSLFIGFSFPSIFMDTLPVEPTYDFFYDS
ncbi:MAG TPA: hypothetical protein VIY29_04695 [Ktedonobacteraceae bacterium]